jgi:outer membrane protein assembly factor BamB
MRKNKHFSYHFQFGKNSLSTFKGLLIMAFGIMFFTHIQAQDEWNQFRGFSRSGVIDQTNFPELIPQTGAELKWSKDIGSGFSEIVLSENKAYVFYADTLHNNYTYLAALDKNNGQELWKSPVDSMWIEVDGWGHGPRSTPAIDDDAIYCLSGYGKFVAFNKNTGSELWKISLPGQFGATIPRWGFSTSPLLIADVVILETGGGDKKAFTAFDKKSGKVVWSTGTGVAAYNSPLVANIQNKDHIVFANDTLLYALNATGELLWQYRMPLRGPMAMPVFIGPNRIFVSSVSNTGSFVVEVQDNVATEVLKSPTMQNNWSSSCYHKGYLYGFSKAKLQCVSVDSGEMAWGKRGFGKGSLIIVGDKLVVLSDQGKIIIVEANPESYQEIASFQTLAGKAWTAPSYSGGHLFIRNLSKVACYKF